MAHIEVVRRSLSLQDWARHVFAQVDALVVPEAFPTEGWQVRTGTYSPEGSTWDGPFQPIIDGETWGRPDAAAEFTGRVAIPPQFAGRPVHLTMTTAAEVIVYVNGAMLDGLDPNRSSLLLVGKAESGRQYDMRFEAYCRSKPDDERSVGTRSHRGCIQTFHAPCLAVIDDEALALKRDLDVLHLAAFGQHLPEEVRERLRKQVADVVRAFPPFECSAEELRATVPRLRRMLAEEVFVDTGPFGRNGRLACVAHSHLDIAYYWLVRQTVQKNARTTLIQLRLMDRHPEFTYAHSQAWCYESLERHYPELFAGVRERVAEGRWEIVGGLYVEPDCNLISAESLARQIVYGKLYFLDRFGIEVDNCWLPDVFGNSPIMPQILKAGGIDYFVSNKMSTWNDTNRFPHNLFTWRGIDGTDIHACVPPVHFITWMDPNQLCESWNALQDKDRVNETLHMYGYGDGGSGVTDEMLAWFDRCKRLPGLPEVRLSTGREYLHRAFDNAPDLDIWDGELYLEMHRGTFTSKADLKFANRRGEERLRAIEHLATVAALIGAPYPVEELRGAWKSLLLNQFHDILPGSQTRPVYLEAMGEYGRLKSKLDAVEAAALDVVAPVGDGLTVINPHSFCRGGVAMVPDTCAGQLQQRPDGSFRTVCSVPEIAGLSAVDLQPGPASASALESADGTLENAFVRLTFDDGGRIASLLDKRNGRESMARPGNDWQLWEDRPGIYNAWDILDRFEDHAIEAGAWTGGELVESGPLSIARRFERRMGKGSRAVQIVRLWAHSPRIDFETWVDWHEDETLLKVAFPFAVRARTFETDTSAGMQQRECHRNTTWQQARFEVCCHKWVRIGEGLFGASLLNDGKYGCDVAPDGTVRLSLLRAPVRPDTTSDRGEHRFTYAVLLDDGDWQRGRLVEEAYDLNAPLVALPGRLPSDALRRPLLHIDSPALHVQAIKCAEDGSGDVIVRLVELWKSRGTATLRPGFAFTRCHQTDLLERPVRDVPVQDGAPVVPYRPFQIQTLRFTTDSTPGPIEKNPTLG